MVGNSSKNCFTPPNHPISPTHKPTSSPVRRDPSRVAGAPRQTPSVQCCGDSTRSPAKALFAAAIERDDADDSCDDEDDDLDGEELADEVENEDHGTGCDEALVPEVLPAGSRRPASGPT